MKYYGAFEQPLGQRPPPKVSQRTLDEMACGRKAIGNPDKVLVRAHHARAEAWLQARFNFQVVRSEFCNGGTGWTVELQVVTQKGQRLVFTEDALAFPTDQLMSQLMLIDQ